MGALERSAQMIQEDLMFDGQYDSDSHAQTTESVVLEEELPEDYEPTEDEILEYATCFDIVSLPC